MASHMPNQRLSSPDCQPQQRTRGDHLGRIAHQDPKPRPKNPTLPLRLRRMPRGERIRTPRGVPSLAHTASGKPLRQATVADNGHSAKPLPCSVGNQASSASSVCGLG